MQGGSGKDYVGLTRKAEEALPKGSDAVATIEKALAALGTPGQDNGVVVAFGDVGECAGGRWARRGRRPLPDGLLLTIRMDADKLKGDAESRAIAHQATEVEDLRKPDGGDGMKIQADAWQTVLLVTIGSRQKTMTLPGGLVYWNMSWPAAEQSPNAGSALTEYLSDREETPR